MGMELFCFNLKGISQMLLPKSIFRANLANKIDKIFKKFDDKTLEHIASRVSYYHKINSPFTLHKPTNECKEKTALGLFEPHYNQLCYNNSLSLSKCYTTAYWYDSYALTKYFSNDLAWCYEFGDVNYYFTQPTISKTRPIHSCFQNVNADCKADNSILLKLNTLRHFTFVKDKFTFKDKENKLVFRGACYGQNRHEFLRQYFSHPKCDLADTNKTSANSPFFKPKLSKKNQMNYKFILSLEGNDVASNLKWIMNSNSLCIMPKPRFESWFMEANLEAGVHYAQLNDSYDNLDDLLEYYLSHEKEACEIINNAHNFVQMFKNKHIEEACNLLVLRKYFYLSGQIDISPNEKALLKL